MDEIRFTWDKKKAKLNFKKHKVSFEEAMTSFNDSNARLIHDPEHSDEEDRYILLGMSCSIRLLITVHCYRKDDSEIRIISARKADKDEQNEYWEFSK
jgi:hypothetical protein